MPAFLWPLVIKLLLNFGVPAVLDWVRRKWGVGAQSEVVQVLSEYAIENRVNKKEAKSKAEYRLKECVGVACPTDTVGP